MIQAKKIAKKFQSTLPVGGATRCYSLTCRNRSNFNPRSPWGERLFVPYRLLWKHWISIHAPREGSDKKYILFIEP